MTRNRIIEQNERELSDPLVLSSQINKIYLGNFNVLGFMQVRRTQEKVHGIHLLPFVKVNLEEKTCLKAIGRNHNKEVIFTWPELTNDQDHLKAKAKATRLEQHVQ